MKRILSCMQPTNRLHLGNYLGALKNWVALQNEGAECFYGVVDLHAVTVAYEADQLATSTQEIAAAYIAAGVDPERSVIFPQSAIAGHSQLMWMLATMTQIGKLNRMTQFKDKAGKNQERAGLGLYAYPVLMAADILVYKATHVPVGEDQKQHLELSRDIASTFNTRYDRDFFIQPEPFITGPAPRVMSLRNGAEKMSKSAPSDMSRINLTDDADMIATKIRKAKTDALAVPSNEAEMDGRPEARNLITLYAALSDQTAETVMAQYGGQAFSAFKVGLTDVAVAHLEPITKRMNDLLNDRSEIDRILTRGAEKANAVAAPVVEEAMDIMGFWK